jgi:beta-lactamase class A
MQGNKGLLMELSKNGMKDINTGIVRLPLLQALLTAGSQVPIGDAKSYFTYVDLRKATNPSLMLAAPAGSQTVTTSISGKHTFIKAGTRAGQDVGHFIPLQFWNYIHRSDVSPDGWKTDFGPPLTEALSLTKNGGTHHMLVQAFEYDGLVLDQDTANASGQPQIQRLDSGTDYLHTIGLPAVAIRAKQTIWAQTDTALLPIPGAGQAVAHVGQNFPLTLLGDTTWGTDMLWYHIQWAEPKESREGWVPANAITFTKPGNAPSQASMDALSPALATYLDGLGNDAGVVVYDMSRQRYYTYNGGAQFIMASSMKVAIMLTFFDSLEHQGREPNDEEMHLLTTMIENSDNDSASTLYFEEIGGAAGITKYMQKIGVSGLNPSDNTWGYSTITPQTMVNLLTLLQEGKILTAHDRDIVLNLMEHIESDQRFGVGDSASNGAIVAMKNGWVPGPDDQWATNSSGIVTLDQETYIISIYTVEIDSFEDGQAILQHVCGTIAPLLT